MITPPPPPRPELQARDCERQATADFDEIVALVALLLFLFCQLASSLQLQVFRSVLQVSWSLLAMA